MILEWAIGIIVLYWIYAERELLSVSIMVNRALSSQEDQVLELLDYTKQYPISLWLHCEFNEEKMSYEEQIIDQFQLFYTYLWKIPDHLDVHKDIPDKITEHILIAFANFYQIPMRNRWDSKIPYKHTDGIRYLGSWKTQEELSKRFELLQDHHTYEIVFHPWYYDPDSSSSLNKKREDDIDMIKRIYQQLDQFNLQLINQHDLSHPSYLIKTKTL